MSMKRVYKRGIETVYRGTKYRSRWEVYVAKLLLYSDITFQYEPQRFFLTNRLSYLPDFYIPSLGIYIEVKGSLSRKDMWLLGLFSQSYKLLYLGKEELKKIHGGPLTALSSKDIINYVPTKEELYRFRNAIESR